jgi:Protein of unknown function (DUF3108)
VKILRLVAAVSIFFVFPCLPLISRPAGAATHAAITGEGGRNAELLQNAKEKFYYNIYWLGIFVGSATLTSVREGGTVTFTSEVHSAPVISVVYKVEDHASSREVAGMPENFRIKQMEGRYRSDKETLFDPAKGRITYTDYRKGIRAEHEVKNFPVWDVISGFYHLRTLLLETGKTVSLNVFDSNKMLKTEVHVLRKEKVAFPGRGDVDALVVKPMLRTEGLFKHKGEILIWLTDDVSRIPVKVETKVSIGKVVAELTRVEIVR